MTKNTEKMEPSTENYFTYRDLTIINELGTGSFGTVILGLLHQCYDRLVAVRKIPHDFGREDDFYQQYKQFSQASNPRFVHYLGFFKSWKYYNLVMEYAVDGSLADEIKLRKSTHVYWSSHDIINLFVDMLTAVEYLHKYGLIHRNLKPSNFLFQTDAYRLKLADIGMTDIMDRTRHSSAYIKLERQSYTAPELLMENLYDEKVDVWSLGIIVYEMCDLRHPSCGRLLTSSITFPPLRRYPNVINDLIRSMLVRDPRERVSVHDLIHNENVKKTYNFYQFL